MQIPFKISGLIAVLLFAAIFVPGQFGDEQFASGSGSFKIALPKVFTSVKELSFREGNLFAQGKHYVWDRPGEYVFQIFYYKIYSDNAVFSPAEKAHLIDPLKQLALQWAKDCGCQATEKEYLFKGNKGVEVRMVNIKAESITRIFLVKKRLFFITLTFMRSADRFKLFNTLESFALLDYAGILKAKLEEAEPAPLPQEPVAPKARTDAEDENLKGKVKSVIEETLYPAAAKRERSAEKYYNQNGNLIRDLDFMEGYPSGISVWGYIDGKRVLNYNYIHFDEDQRPPMRNIFILEAAAEDPSLSKDTRYSSRREYKYDEKTRLVESLIYGNNGRLQTRTVFSYTNDQRQETDFGDDGSVWSRSVDILDKNGNSVEEYSLDENGKPADRSINVYQFDTQGNWIVQKTYKKTLVKGKSVLKLLWPSYRTITYYP